MRRRTTRAVLAAVGVSAMLAGCTGGGEEPLGMSTVTAEPTPTQTATPTPTPTQTALPDEIGVVANLTDPELGIVFEDIPDLTGDEADVYNAIALYEREAWRSMSTNEVSPVFVMFTSAGVQAEAQRSVDANVTGGNTIGGVLHVTVEDINVDGNGASATACRDYREATFVDAERTYTPEEAGLGEPSRIEMTASGMGQGKWRIETIAKVGTC